MEGSKQFILTENDKNLIIAGIALISVGIFLYLMLIFVWSNQAEEGSHPFTFFFVIFFCFIGLMLIIYALDKETTKVYDKWICPYCKNQLRWIEAFSRWYCDHCERYF
jgi:uncharacterized membrane protein HdeD (DUF308 family)